MENWTSVKEYAENHGISAQAVYQQLKRKKNRDFIAQHSKKEHGTTYLDADAVRYLENQRDSSPAVVVVENSKERIQELEHEKEVLLLQVTELQKVIIAKSERIEQLQQNLLDSREEYNKLLIEQKEQPQRKWWEFWK